MTALTEAFTLSAVLCFIAAMFSALRGKKYVFSENANGNGASQNKSAAKATSK